MKPSIRWILVSVLACAICSVAAFSIAYHGGYKNGYGKGLDSGIAGGRFGESLDICNALWMLRAGDFSRATRSLETQCFASAKIYYNNPTPTGDVQPWSNMDAARTLAKELSTYRAAYRTNSADWDDWERKLEIQLAKIKSDDEKAWDSIVIKPIDIASNFVVTPSSQPQ